MRKAGHKRLPERRNSAGSTGSRSGHHSAAKKPKQDPHLEREVEKVGAVVVCPLMGMIRGVGEQEGGVVMMGRMV